jgi:hypothetical protein
MPHQSIDIGAQYVKCCLIGNEWDRSSLESIATAQKITRCGSPSKTTSLPSGDSETGESGARGCEHSKTSFYDGGWE